MTSNLQQTRLQQTATVLTPCLDRADYMGLPSCYLSLSVSNTLLAFAPNTFETILSDNNAFEIICLTVPLYILVFDFGGKVCIKSPWTVV